MLTCFHEPGSQMVVHLIALVSGYAGSLQRNSLGASGNSDDEDSDSEPHSSAAANVCFLVL